MQLSIASGTAACGEQPSLMRGPALTTSRDGTDQSNAFSRDRRCTMLFVSGNSYVDQVVRTAGAWPLWCAVLLLLVYLFQINRLLSGTPEDLLRLSPSTARWTREMLRETYKRLEKTPITTESYAHQLPPKLQRRYIVTGGSGEGQAVLRWVFHLTRICRPGRRAYRAAAAGARTRPSLDPHPRLAETAQARNA